MDQYIGKMLDNRYELLEVVGVGGMAVVYKAMCHRLNRYVAVKILKPEAAADPELRRRFRDESQAVAMLSHPNIVAVYDVSKTENLEYIVMELIDGITLKQYMRQKGGPLPWKEALHFITQVMRALRHAHSRGIVHRDIKPQNIMVLRDGSCKVADFGIAHLGNSQNTMTQEALGSVHYIAPEQAKGAKVDARTDIYSAGVVLYEMLAGHLPYEGDSAVAVALQHINTTPPMPSSYNPSIPFGLEQITMKAMAMNPGDRYESARAMLLDLDSFRKNPKTVFPYVTGQEPLTQIPKLSDEDETQLITDNGNLYGTPTTTRPEHRTAYTDADDENSGSRKNRNNGSGKKKKSSKAPIIIVAAVIIIFLILAGLFVSRTLSGSGTGEEVTIPDLVGMQYNDAVLEYGDSFDIQIGAYTEDDSQTEGAILDQDPEADSTSTSSRPTITVTVCIHSDSITMPDVSGMTETEALQALIAAGISSSNIIKGTSVYSSDVEEGYVVSTDPVSGSPVTSDTQVTYYLSKGADPDAEEEADEDEEAEEDEDEEEEDEEDAVETVTVPNFVGSTRTQVLAQLKSLGLSGTFKEVSDSSAAGTVLTQSVASGTEVEVGTTITFTVSTGPEETDDDADDDDADSTDDDTADTSDSTADTSDSTESTGSSSSVTVDRQITITLPTDRDEVSVSVTVGGTTAYSRSGVDTSAGSMTVTISGSGTQTVAVYIDGTLSTSYDVTFN